MSKKGENIYKRKDDRWEARYIKGYGPDGSVRYGYCYGKSYREAKQKVTEAKAALLTGKAVPTADGHQRFSQYCDEWLHVNRSRVKESTYAKYTVMLENHIKPQLGGYCIKALSTMVVEQFSHRLLYEEELAPKTVRDILTLLHSILQYTARQIPGVLPPVEIVYPKNPQKEMRVLSKSEQTRLTQYLLQDADRHKFGVLLALITGMRIGEICALRWGNISLEERCITIAATMQRLKNPDNTAPAKTKVIISDPKSDRSARVIPMTDYAVDLCRRYWENDPDAFVLTGEACRYVEPRVLQYRLGRYTAACGLEGVHFHVLRHTFATRCVEVGFEIKSLSEILGHASPRITLERYVHSSMELKRNNMDKLAAIGF